MKAKRVLLLSSSECVRESDETIGTKLEPELDQNFIDLTELPHDRW